MNEMVNHPSHYGGENNPYEVIKVIEAWQLDFHLGTAVKYIPRAGKKDPEKEIEDLEKAIWYIQRKIKTLKEHHGTGEIAEVIDAGFDPDVETLRDKCTYSLRDADRTDSKLDP